MADTTAIEASQHNVTPDQHTRISTAKSHIKYLIDPKSGPQPVQFRTRAFLRSFRYFSLFLFWRLVRYAKYAAVGAIIAAVSGTAIGSVVSGAAFVIAPTGILGGATVGLMWAVARFGWSRARHRMRKKGGEEGADPRKDEQDDAEVGLEREAVPFIPKAEPW